MSDLKLIEIEQAVHAWVDEHWDPELSLIEWRNILVDGGKTII